jgi:hypothetical protein
MDFRQIFSLAVCCFVLNAGAIAHGAQSANRPLEYAPDPQIYVRELLQEAATKGMDPIRAFTDRLGVRSPQFDATLESIDALSLKRPENIVRLLTEVETGGALRQIYAYTYFGNNVWFFWRFDFVMTDKGWAVSAFNFDNDYAKVKAVEFASAVTNPIKP